MDKSIREFLEQHGAKSPVSFHMPGHKGKKFYEQRGYQEFLRNLMDMDITEIPGADNLFQAESIILGTMEKYERLYGSRKSYLLINGSSGGILASILATVPKGGRLIMARNCHKSVFNALSLGDISPVYVFPDEEEGHGILGQVSVKEIRRALDENPESSAVILPSPNYYGICSDIKAIAGEIHKRGKILIVDQAHGAHLKFFNDLPGVGFPEAAETAGADIVINSTHKTLASFTQTAVLNVCSERVDLNVLEDKLQAVESSSPSYPLMATLDINADIITEEGHQLMEQWADNLKWFYEEAGKIPGLSVMKTDNLDYTKLNIDMSAYGCNGNQLEEILMNKGIFIELVAGNIIMCMTGIGNVREDYKRLLEALREIAKEGVRFEKNKKVQPAALTKRLKWQGIPARKERIPLDEASGRICAASIIPYPPGIPIACPGEILDEEILAYIKGRKEAGEKVIGLSENYTVEVGKL